MRLRSKETYWLLKNGLLCSYPSLQKNISCEVLIIGGGITGALIAYQLSKEGYGTVLIDKRDIAMGSTSATTAMLQYEIDEPLYSLIDKVGENAAVDSYQEGVLAIDKHIFGAGVYTGVFLVIFIAVAIIFVLSRVFKRK